MISKLKSGEYRLYSRKRNPGTGKRRNVTFYANRAGSNLPAGQKDVLMRAKDELRKLYHRD